MAMTRREFTGSVAALLASLGWQGCVRWPKGDETLPPWRLGELDLHFIYTGCGENMFYRLPDGTAIVNDVGDYYRPRDLDQVPLLPDDSRLGGEWVSRYIQRVYGEKTLDYALFSHWHSDHIGHTEFDRKKTKDSDFRFRVLPDGRNVDGFLSLAEDFNVRRLLVHDYTFGNRGNSGDSSLALLKDYVAAQRPKGLQFEEFKVGALDQIRLQRDAAKYAKAFSIRNLSANGRIWDGKDGVIDFAGDYFKATKKKRFDQNMLSMGFVMKYGKFSYLAAGDFQRNEVTRAKGKKMLMDGLLGKLAGKVSIVKMLHHGCSNAMSQEFLDAVQADAYVACMWCPGQSHPNVMTRITQAGAATGRKPLILPQLICKPQRKWATETNWDFGFAQAVHVVVRVAPGGDSYRVYLLDAATEDQRIVATFDR